MSSDDESSARIPKDNGDDSLSDVPEKQSPPGENSPPPLDEDKGADNDDEDLFGSGSDNDDERPHRDLDDEQLDSGDDENRWDRRGSPMEEDGAEYRETLNIMDLSLGRTTDPESTDGQIYTLSMPNFLSIESEDFNPETYVAPPFSSASTSLCWRYDPNDENTIQSNARVIRWSDGSLTLQLASNPTEQYRMPFKPLARSNTMNKTGDLKSELDSHVYLGAASEASSVIRVTSHLTDSLTILPSAVETDDAVQRLQESLAAASRTGRKNADGSVAMFDVTQDPELAKKQAEQAEREKLREARRRQMVEERSNDRARRVGLSVRTGGAGLSVAGLEGDDQMASTKGRTRRRANRRDEIYTDDEEDYGRRGRTREDEYEDDGDGFVVDSDVEPEIGEDEDEEEADDEDLDADGEIDDDVPPVREKERGGPRASPKRTLEEDRDQPGPAASGSPPVRKKPRYVVDDEDDE